jgi:hypothetical protein
MGLRDGLNTSSAMNTPKVNTVSRASQRRQPESLLGLAEPLTRDKDGKGVKTENSYTAAGGKSAAISGGLAGLSALQSISNAQSAYDALKEQNKINAMELDRAEGIILQQGSQAILDMKRGGEENAISAQLSLAAQGQNLSSAGAQKTSESYEAMGVYNAMIEEINMMRSVYDINFQRIEMKRAEGLAKAQKKNAMFSGILSTGAAAVGGYFGGAAGAAAAGGITSSLTSEDFTAQ